MGRSLAEMIKLVYCITRRRDLSLEEFSRYWHDVHGPIGRQIPGLRRLVQSHPLVASGQRMDFDGLAELWFDDLDALRAAQTSAEWPMLYESIALPLSYVGVARPRFTAATSQYINGTCSG